MTFAEAWKENEGKPQELRHIRLMQWEDFKESVEKEEDHFVQTLVGSLCLGDAWILKGAFAPRFIDVMRKRVISWCKQRPSEFHKMLDFCPDFHRVIDEEVSGLYSIRAIKHSAYFFRWNDDPLGIWPQITERWRVLKKAMGLNPLEYEDNRPSDGPVDRIQIVRYPPQHGFLEPHRDSAVHQKCFISGYMSKRGVDYQGGGFYFIQDGKQVFAEDQIDVGDLCIAYADVLHGVAPCEGEYSWEKDDGRWFLGLYSNAPDTQANRSTAKAVKVEGVS
jgi:hypothetical protein